MTTDELKVGTTYVSKNGKTRTIKSIGVGQRVWYLNGNGNGKNIQVSWLVNFAKWAVDVIHTEVSDGK